MVHARHLEESEKKQDSAVIPAKRIEKAILLIRGHKVMLDADLAGLYGVSTASLNRAVSRNPDRSLAISCSSSPRTSSPT